MKQARLYNIIQGSYTTEKSVKAAEKYRQITFMVIKDASKDEIKEAVEKLFNVVVAAVRVINIKGKLKLFKRTKGKRSGWKKALITLQEGHDINLAEFK